MKKNKIQSAQLPTWPGAAAIFLLSFLVYWPVFHAGFIWDDNAMLTENIFVKARNGLRYLWFSTGPVDYFPLAYTSFWLEWRLWGMNATGYHITNVFLHAASSVLLWRIFKQLKISGAWLAALIFAIHPVNVESVAWIAERKNTLCMFFFAWSILFFLRSENLPAARNSKFKTQNFQYGLSLVFFLLALLSKTSVVMLPFVLLLCVWWRNRKIAARDVWRTSPFFALSLALGLATVWFQQHRAIAEDVVRDANLWTRFGDAAMAIWFYLYKAIFPLRLSFVYPEWETGRTLFSLLALLGLLISFAAFWRKRQTWGRPLLFAFGYFVLMLLPILGLLNIYFHRYSLVADHWQYFALPGVIALLVAVVSDLLKSQMKPQRAFIWAAGLCVVSWLAFATSQQAMIYKNSETLWRDTLSKNPNSWLALNNFGLLLDRNGKTDKAILQFEKSLRLKPNQVEGCNNLGSALLGQGRFDEAMAAFQRALETNPKFPVTHYNIANVLDQQGKANEAVAEFREALRLDPNYADAHNNLGCMLVIQGKIEEGMAHFREVLRINPNNTDALNNLGSTLIESGKPDEAIPWLVNALKIKSDYADAHYNLGNALLALNQTGSALEHYIAALKINPQSPLAHYKTGNAFAQLGKADEAIGHYLRALQLNPNLPEAHYQIAVLSSAGKRMEPAIAHFKEAIRLKPDWMEPLNNLAWILATYPDGKFRDGKSAVEFAERACVLSENKNAGVLDTLSAAYAEAGQLAKADSTASKAADLATVSGDKAMLEQIRAHQELYRAGKPFRQ